MISVHLASNFLQVLCLLYSGDLWHMVIDYDDEFILQLVLFKCNISPAPIMVGFVLWGPNSDEHFSESITVAVFHEN